MDYLGQQMQRKKHCPKKEFLSRHSTDSDNCANYSSNSDGHTQSMLDLLANGVAPPRHQRVENMAHMSLPDDLRLSFSEIEDSPLLDDIDLECSPSVTELTSNNMSGVDQNRDMQDKVMHKLNAVISSTSDIQPQYMNLSAVSERLQSPKERNCASRVRDGSCEELAIKEEGCNDQQDYSWSNMNSWNVIMEPSSDHQVFTVGSSGVAMQKKKMSPRRSTKNKHMENVSCQVCNDIAAGFYCGAFICEACKKFYMRAYKQDKLKYVCLRDKKCVITKESRVQCQYCRFQKCVQLNMYCPKQGESESSKDTQMSDIPCRVCFAPSSGFHFGAITCEGCKGFFRRMAKEREPERYQCNKKGACEINMITRNLCKACRYRACIRAGMSVEGSRIGRQPNSVKHAISLELKTRSAGCSDAKIKEEPMDVNVDYSDEKSKTEDEFWNSSVNKVSVRTDSDNQNTTYDNHEGTLLTLVTDGDYLGSYPLSVNCDSNMVYTSHSWGNGSGVSSPESSPSTGLSLKTGYTDVKSEFLPSCSTFVSSLEAQSKYNMTFPQNVPASVTFSHPKHMTTPPNTPVSPSVTLPKHHVITPQNITVSDSGSQMAHNMNLSPNMLSPTITPPKNYETSPANSQASVLGIGYQSKLHILTPPPTPTLPVSAQTLQHKLNANVPTYTCKMESGSSVSNTFTTSSVMTRPTPRMSQPAQQAPVQDYAVLTNTGVAPVSQGGFLDNEDASLKTFISKIVEAGKCLQLLNYRVFDTDVNATTSMSVDDVKALFKSKYMDPKAGNHITSSVDMSVFSTRESTWNYIMTNFHHNTYITIRFAKMVPGFKTLSLNDQVKLIQSSIYPIELLNMAKVFDPVTKKYNYFTYTKEEENIMMDQFPMLRVFQEHFLHVGEMVTSFQFTDEEFALLSALLLFPAEIGGLENPQAVERLQNEISNALQYYEEKAFPDGLTRYGILLVRVAELVQCLLQHNLAIGLLLTHNPTIKVPQLFHELIIESIKEGQKSNPNY